MLKALWIALVICVVVGSLLPAGSPALNAIGKLHVNDKLLHFAAYLALSFLAVHVFPNRRKGIQAGASMFLLGVILEFGQHFSPGRSVELGDVIANGIGVISGLLLSSYPRSTCPP